MISLGAVFSWVACGVIVGLGAQALGSGRRNMPIAMTTTLGIAGALLGGIVFSLFRGASVAPFAMSVHNLYGWLVALMGAVLLVWLFVQIDASRG